MRITSVKEEKKPTVMKDVPRASRRPAAIVGMVLFVLIGVALMQGMTGLLGQVQTQATIIRVTPVGVEPPIVTVVPGQTVTWKNEDAIPHIFASDTLPTMDGKPFESSPLFPQAEYSHIIPAAAATGSHEYFSKTSASVMGQIVIATPTATPVPQQPAATEPLPLIPENTQPVTTPFPTSDAEGTETFDAGLLPENPHTVGSGEAPVPYRPQPGTNTPAPQAAINQHRPVTNTETGTGNGILIAAITVSAIGLLVVTRKSFAKIA